MTGPRVRAAASWARIAALVAALVAVAPTTGTAAPLAVGEEAPAPGVEYRVERISFVAAADGGSAPERELERALNRWARQGWVLDQVLQWSAESALVVLRR